ncbi:MAG: helix-turn-helix domain-containing protein [Treponema sp.]|nr:helix-turn-helix domain-containing protein [Treponema sp.]
MKNKINENYIRWLLSSKVKRFRSVHNISQMELAIATGLTHNFINDIENCKKGISVNTLAKLSNYFNVEPHQFFLPENSNSETMLYVKDFNDSLQKIVADLTEQYLAKDKKAK